MKRLIAYALLCCLLLCACGHPAEPKETQPTTEPATQTQPTTESLQQTQPATEPAAESTSETQEPTGETTEPTQSVEEKVTVYLLKKVTYFDSGSVEYHYDENYNIDSYTIFTLENTVMCEVFFEEKDANGMACVVRNQWPEGIEGEIRNLTYFEDGRLKEEQFAGSNFSGCQYEYDREGNLIEKREYYDGMLISAVYFEYDYDQLTIAYCEDNAGSKVFECWIENGRIVAKIFLDSGEDYGYRYEYDENNNMVSMTLYYEGETFPGDQYFYEAVEVDADRVRYLQEQQKYLIPIV